MTIAQGSGAGPTSILFGAYDVQAAPEPSNLLFGGLAVLMGLGDSWRRRKAKATT